MGDITHPALARIAVGLQRLCQRIEVAGQPRQLIPPAHRQAGGIVATRQTAGATGEVTHPMAQPPGDPGRCQQRGEGGGQDDGRQIARLTLQILVLAAAQEFTHRQVAQLADLLAVQYQVLEPHAGDGARRPIEALAAGIAQHVVLGAIHVGARRHLEPVRRRLGMHDAPPVAPALHPVPVAFRGVGADQIGRDQLDALLLSLLQILREPSVHAVGDEHVDAAADHDIGQQQDHEQPHGQP